VFFSQNNGTDPIARRFRAMAATWIDIDGCDDGIVAKLIREARIDILIDLGGYGEGGRLSVCALRPAPVQVKWVGMQCHSTGLPAIDWFLSDRWETPPELDEVYSERVLRLPDGYVCYSPPPHAPDVSILPALANGYVTFGCFNNLAKMTPGALACWSTILHLQATASIPAGSIFKEPPATAPFSPNTTRSTSCWTRSPTPVD
jgi:protein O-GlcNAc transferase